MKFLCSIPAALAALVLCTAQATASTAADSVKAKPVIEKGMDADTIIRTFGKPNEIQPMKDSGVQAEKWIYRRKAREYTTQDASDIAMLPAFIGISGTGTPMMADVPTLEYRVKFIKVYQVTALLMVDGRLVIAKQWAEQEEKYTN